MTGIALTSPHYKTAQSVEQDPCEASF